MNTFYGSWDDDLYYTHDCYETNSYIAIALSESKKKKKKKNKEREKKSRKKRADQK